jgi:hypothetical protein
VTARFRILGNLAPYAFSLLLALGLPARAVGQAQSRDTTGASAPVKDLPLTAAERQAFVGSYSVTLPFGEQRSLHIVEDNGVLKGQPDDQEAQRLLYRGDNVFQPEGIPDMVFTFVLEGGRATKFTVRRPDGVMHGIRVR